MTKTEIFIEKARQIYGDKYDYSKVEYKNAYTKVCIICPTHGEFWQTPNNHLMGHGCYNCGKRKKTTNDFIEESIKIHGSKYDYSKTEYTSANNKVCIICPEHGEFFIRASSHLSGCGCKKCATKNTADSQRKDIKLFIEEARAIHGNKYDYTKSEYINVNKKICIICPEHGEFWQTPNAHIRLREGCPQCKNSRMCDYLTRYLTENNVIFEKEKTFEWLKYKNNMLLDYYLPEYNIAIECQGGQHFVNVKKFGGSNGLKVIQERDYLKYQQCLENNVKIIYILPKRYKKNIREFIYNKDNTIIFEDPNFLNILKTKLIK